MGRVAAAAAVGVLATGLLGGCGGGDATPSPAPSFPVAPSDGLWNPCDSLSAATVGRLLGGTVTKDVGDASAPQCAFVPTTEGDPAVTANYSLVPGTIEELIGTFGTANPATRVLSPDVARADGARLIVTVQGGILTVSGFVKNGDLVQSLNVIAPRPFRRRPIVAGATGLLRLLAAHADESGLTAKESASGSPSGSPSPSESASATPRPSAPATS